MSEVYCSNCDWMKREMGEWDDDEDMCPRCRDLLDENGEPDLEYLKDVARLMSDAHLDREATNVRRFKNLLEAQKDD